MGERIKKVFYSEKGMAAVDTLFLLAMLIPNRGITFAACLVWIVYLGCRMKKSPHKAGKIINGGLIVLAAVLIAVNLYFMLRYYGTGAGRIF